MTNWPFLVRILARKPEVLFLLRLVPCRVCCVILLSPGWLLYFGLIFTIFYYTILVFDWQFFFELQDDGL
jgi:hypothetical protein